jgi:hypothetical protein
LEIGLLPTSSKQYAGAQIAKMKRYGLNPLTHVSGDALAANAGNKPVYSSENYPNNGTFFPSFGKY